MSKTRDVAYKPQDLFWAMTQATKLGWNDYQAGRKRRRTGADLRRDLGITTYRTLHIRALAQAYGTGWVSAECNADEAKRGASC